jgi:hypothetical protein
LKAVDYYSTNAKANITVEKGWWFSASDSSYNALDKTDVDLGFEQSLEYLKFRIDGKQPTLNVISVLDYGAIGDAGRAWVVVRKYN